jgi:3-oxoacyl-[acyl-carrier protein] reductase
MSWDLAPQGSQKRRSLLEKQQHQPPQLSAGKQIHCESCNGMDTLAGKVALVTGGSKGIGKATCLALSRLGAFIAINYASDPGAADALVQDIGAETAIGVRADASSIKGAEEMVKTTVDKFGKIDILVANAGILPLKDLENTSEQDFDRAFGLNVKGPYFLAQKAAPHMGPGSHIVFVSTTQNHASTVTPNYLLYCSTKGAIEQMTKVVRASRAQHQGRFG